MSTASADAPPVEVLTFGCRLNAAESEVMRGHAAGLSGTVIVNTCAVTAEAERQARQAIRRVHRDRPGARIVVTGCAAQIAPDAWAALPGVARVLGNEEKLRASFWRDDAPARAVGDIAAATRAVPHAAARAEGRVRAYLEIQQGCDHACTFCIIPRGRGPSRSVPLGAIVERARALLAGGAAELVLTGVDLTAYGADLPGRPSLGDTVRRLLRLVPELRRLRLSSLDPEEIDPALWRAIAEEDRLLPHLHLSLQAGSDLILKRMRRRHTRAGAAAAIARARALRPGIAIGADLIAGFPTETDALFRETMDFLATQRIPYLHVFPYSERPGTPAARMPAVAVPERRARAAALRDAGRAAAAAFHEAQAGRVDDVLIERPGLGRSRHFSPVRIAGGAPGEIVAARITGGDAGGLYAEAA